MESSQPAHETTPIPGINTIPDELLLKILAYVPYPGPTLTNTFTSIKQHDSLRLVSSRFNAVLSDSAFNTQLARCQYNDVVQLYGFKTIATNAELRDIATRTANTDALVSRLVPSNNPLIRTILRFGVLILENLKSANTNLTRNEWMTLISWANDSVFSLPVQLVLRFTLGRFQDTFVTDSLDPVAMLSGHDFPTDNDLLKSTVDETFAMFKYRAFETAFLLGSQPLSVLAESGRELEKVLFQARIERPTIACPLKIYAPSLAMAANGTTPADFEIHEEIQAEHIEYFNGHQWRLLSPRAVTKASDESGLQAAYNQMINQIWGEWTLDRYLDFNAHTETYPAVLGKLDINLRAVGKFLRSATDMIKSKNKDVPKVYLKYAEEVSMLRGTSGDTVDDETGDDGVDEDEWDEEYDGSYEDDESEDSEDEGDFDNGYI